MSKHLISTSDPDLIRLMAATPELKTIPLRMFPAESSGHKFSPGETRELTGLESFPEFNGQSVLIESIREDGTKGRAYYVKGEINKFLNWVYEYRLK